MHRKGEGVTHPVIPPDPDIHELLVLIRYQADVDSFSQKNIGDINNMFEQRDPAVPVDDAFCFEIK